MAIPFEWICADDLDAVEEIARQPTYTHLPSPGDWDFMPFRSHIQPPLDYAVWSVIINSRNPVAELDPQRYELIPVTHTICFWHRILTQPWFNGPGKRLTIYGRRGHWYESTRHLGWGGTQTPCGPREVATGYGPDPFGDIAYNSFAEGRLYDVEAMKSPDRRKRYVCTVPTENYPFTSRVAGAKDLFIETNERSSFRPSKRRKLLEDFYVRDPSAGPIAWDIILLDAEDVDKEQSKRKAGNAVLLVALPTPEDIMDRIGGTFRPTLSPWSDSDDDCLPGSEEEWRESRKRRESELVVRDAFWDQWEEAVDEAWRLEGLEVEDVCLDEVNEMGHWLDEVLTV